MTVNEYQQFYNNKYHKIVGRVVRSMEKEVLKLLGDHPELSTDTAWDIVIKAYRQADNTVGGGYRR